MNVEMLRKPITGRVNRYNSKYDLSKMYKTYFFDFAFCQIIEEIEYMKYISFDPIEILSCEEEITQIH